MSGLGAAIDQMYRRNELWNRLVEIDNEVRTRMEALLFAGAKEEQLALLRERLRQLLRRRSIRSADGNVAKSNADELTGQINDASAAVRSALNEVKRLRKENVVTNRLLLRSLDDERRTRIGQVGVRTTLHWANRDEVQRNYEIARARAMKQGRHLRPRAWTGGGRITIHFQKGLKPSAAFAQNGRLQIDPVPEAAWNSPLRAVRRHLARTHARIRIAANTDRSAIWLEFPLIMHRPLPDNGVIRSVHFVRERVGLRWRHRLLVTVKQAALQELPTSKMAVGVDVGWRVTLTGYESPIGAPRTVIMVHLSYPSRT